MDAHVRTAFFLPRVAAMLFGVFGIIGLVLAAVGLYGVMAYAVARRTREIGIRMALGAERARVLRMVLSEVFLMASGGVLLGLIAAFFATRRVQAQLFGLSPSDPLTLVSAMAVLLTVAMLAGFGPARRATSIDPNVAL